MKVRLLLLTISFSILSGSQAQTVIFTENWTSGGAGWTLNVPTGAEGADANFFIVADNEGGGITPDLGAPGSCGVANNSNNTLHVTSVFNPSGGAAYDAGGLCGILFCPQADRRCESPIINCTGLSAITLNFNYIENGQAALDNARVFYNDGTGWTLLDDPLKTLTGCGGQGLWVSHSITLPGTADNNPNVQIAFHWMNNDDGVGTDPSFAVDDISVTGTAAIPVVTIAPSPNDSLCVNSTLTLNGSATNGPITAWAWTVSPNAGVVFTPDTAAQNPTITFTTAGTYTFTLQATNGSGNGTNTQIITILPALTPSLSVAATPTNPICAGATVNFTATPTNGGSSPTYQWQVNGINAGSNSPNFSSGTLVNNDVVTVTLTTSDTCVTTATASASYTIQTGTTLAVVDLSADDTSICQGTTINFTATPTNGGATPTFQWEINGAIVGSNSPNFSSSTLNNGDTVAVILSPSADACPSVASVSDTLFIVVSPTVAASVSLAADDTSICSGTTVNFTATPTNGGITPVYQWEINGAVVGSNSPNFSSGTINNGDTVAVIMTSNLACAMPLSSSDTLFMVVNPVVVPTVTVIPDPANACSGDSVIFSATTSNGGTVPAFQWVVNGSNTGTNNDTLVINPVSANATVFVMLTSTVACATPATVNSNTVSLSVLPSPTLSVSQSAVVTCPNDNDTLIATATTGSTFTWTPAAGLNSTTNDTVFANNALAGTYTYFVTADLAGCTTTDSIVVTVGQTFTASAGPAQTICFGDSANLSVTGGTSWTWTPNGDLSCSACQNPVATSPATTTYTVVAAMGGCTDTVTQTVTVIPNASPSFNTTVVQQGIPQVIAFTNTSTNATGYFWTLGNGFTSVLTTPANQTYNVAGTYTVVLIAYGVNGCNDTIPTVIFVNDTVGISVPNIFTPNGDQINDVWQPSVHGAKDFECTIYNRYGVLVYEFLDDQDKWDGHTTAGSACTDGTYYYILKASDINNKSYNLKGYIQLIR